ILGRSSHGDLFSSYWVDGLTRGSLTEADVVLGIVTSAEYTSRFADDRAFITEIYRTVLNRPAGSKAAEIDYQLQALRSGVTSRAGIVLSFLNSDEAAIKAVLHYYENYLHRFPNPVEMRGWVLRLENGDETPASAQAKFLGTMEYFTRVTSQSA